MKRFTLFIAILFASTAFVRAQNSDTPLYLDNSRSILLPYFDLTTLESNKILEISLSLFLLYSNVENKTVQLTINPYNPRKHEIRDGLSTFFEPKLNAYNQIKLPIGLFADFLRSGEQLLIRMVDQNSKLVFQGADTAGTTTDPKLIITFDDPSDPPPKALQDLANKINESATIPNNQINCAEGSTCTIIQANGDVIGVSQQISGAPIFSFRNLTFSLGGLSLGGIALYFKMRKRKASY